MKNKGKAMAAFALAAGLLSTTFLSPQAHANIVPQIASQHIHNAEKSSPFFNGVADMSKTAEDIAPFAPRLRYHPDTVRLNLDTCRTEVTNGTHPEKLSVMEVNAVLKCMDKQQPKNPYTHIMALMLFGAFGGLVGRDFYLDRKKRKKQNYPFK